jgi:hypothetical protein
LVCNCVSHFSQKKGRPPRWQRRAAPKWQPGGPIRSPKSRVCDRSPPVNCTAAWAKLSAAGMPTGLLFEQPSESCQPARPKAASRGTLDTRANPRSMHATVRHCCARRPATCLLDTKRRPRHPLPRGGALWRGGSAAGQTAPGDQNQPRLSGNAFQPQQSPKNITARGDCKPLFQSSFWSLSCGRCVSLRSFGLLAAATSRRCPPLFTRLVFNRFKPALTAENDSPIFPPS